MFDRVPVGVERACSGTDLRIDDLDVGRRGDDGSDGKGGGSGDGNTGHHIGMESLPHDRSLSRVVTAATPRYLAITWQILNCPIRPLRLRLGTESAHGSDQHGVADLAIDRWLPAFWLTAISQKKHT